MKKPVQDHIEDRHHDYQQVPQDYGSHTVFCWNLISTLVQYLFTGKCIVCFFATSLDVDLCDF